MDPPSTSDGAPYGPTRFKELVKERYLISKYTNTTYSDTGSITPIERGYIFEFITEELQKQKEAYEQIKREQEAKKRK